MYFKKQPVNSNTDDCQDLDVSYCFAVVVLISLILSMSGCILWLFSDEKNVRVINHKESIITVDVRAISAKCDVRYSFHEKEKDVISYEDPMYNRMLKCPDKIDIRKTIRFSNELHFCFKETRRHLTKDDLFIGGLAQENKELKSIVDKERDLCKGRFLYLHPGD